MKRKIGVNLLLIVSFLSILSSAPVNAHSPQNDGGQKIALELQASMDTLAPGEMVTAIVTLVDQADLSAVSAESHASRQQEVVLMLQAKSRASQRAILALLGVRGAQGKVSQVTEFWVFNGLSVTATAEVIQELAASPDVAQITPDEISVVPAAQPPEANLALTNAPALWGMGYTGQGIVVANLDSGVDISHPELAARWRGGSNSWYDPYGQHPATPTDLSGHGTQTMGVMVGGEASGTAIGVAPGARWIAAKIFNDQGTATATAIHLGFQWLLDPDSNPGTPDAPQVVNNSWTYGAPGCNLEFQLDLRSLRAAGILPVFSAGNYGPSSSTSVSPANYPEAFALGATNNSDLLYGYSSRGPSACSEAQTYYPDLVAPGVSIKTTDLLGGYYSATGTSLAAPHAAGALALLLDAFPSLSAAQQDAALRSSAVDLGLPGADNDFGAGRLDILAAYNWLLAGGGNPTPTPSPTPTPTPTPAPVTRLHIGDLDRTSTPGSKSWTATVTILVHDAAEKAVPNATVSGKWSKGASGTGSCVTNSSGICTLSKTGLKNTTSSVTFSVTNVTHATLTYQATSNHDPEGDSNGTLIVINRP